MSSVVMAAMPRVTRRYDNAAANQKGEDGATGFSSGGPRATGSRDDDSDTAFSGYTKSGASAPGSGYTPVTSSDLGLRCVTFTWARACTAYGLHSASAIHSGGGQHVNHPVIGDLAMPPGTGRYFFEVRVNSASCRIGVCTQNAYPGERGLEACELGQLPGGVKPDQQTSAHHQQPNGSNEAPHVAVLDGQTSRVLVNGKEVKHLWRLFIATCGALFSFVVDTNDGVVQLFVDKKYEGMVFDANAGLQGKTLYPCVSLAGIDMHNRSIGSGNLGAVVCAPHKFDCLY